MIQEPYTNKNLSDDYDSLRAALYLDADKKTRELIRTAVVDIPSFYEESGSLKGLPVKGIGRLKRADLELLLKEGLQEAIRIREQQISQRKGRPSLGERITYPNTILPVNPSGIVDEGSYRHRPKKGAE